MKRYYSEACAAIHETMEYLYEDGAISKKTMREFDDLCLVSPSQFSPQEIRELRERERVSQPVFARHINVSKNLVSAWERGVKKPGGMALLLLSLIKARGLEAVKI